MHTTRYRAVGAALLVATVLATWRFTPVAAATTIFRNSFDRQHTGALVTGPGPNQFSGTRGSSHLSVGNTVAASPPNALAVTVDGGGSERRSAVPPRGRGGAGTMSAMNGSDRQEMGGAPALGEPLANPPVLTDRDGDENDENGA
jgi:hypothetical protein